MKLEGEFYTDTVSRSIYSQDASIYQITPQAILCPRSAQEIQKSIIYAATNKVTITPRGAGTNTTGAALGTGIILDLSKHLRSIRSFDEKTARVIVDPGVVQDDLNTASLKYGLRLGPDTSTGDRATIGGMVGTNAAGSRSLRFGSMRDAVVGIKLMLASGESIWLRDMHESEYNEQPLLKELLKIASSYHEEISTKFPDFKRSSTGYPLRELLNPKSVHFGKFIAGSQGTLGVITAIELQLVPKLPQTSLLVLSFDTVIHAIEASSKFLDLNPISLELLDKTILESALLQNYEVPHGVDPHAGALIIAEFEKETTAPVLEGSYKSVILKDPDECRAIWAIRKAGLGLLLSRRSKRRAIGFIEDMAVPPKQVTPFFKELTSLFNANEIQAGVYGHVGAGCLHIRPFFNLIEDRKRIEELSEKALWLVKKYQGVYSSEHGEGLLRSWATKPFFGEKLFQAMKEIKSLFDPKGLMNPGKIIPNQALLDNVRQMPLSSPFEPVFKSYQQGGLALTVDLCNGNGACRKKSGTMCPSFQATLDEHDSTRARALALKGILTGDIPQDAIFSKDFSKVFDLCLSCKGCARECPSQIDVSKLKAEITNYTNKIKGTSLRSRIFGRIGSYLKMGSLFPKISNWMMHTFLGRLLGVDQQALPNIAKERFSSWASANQLLATQNPDLILFSDTFTEFLHPEVGIAAVKVLQSIGKKVRVLPWNCCGRTAISKGFLDQSKKLLSKLYDTLSYSNCPLIVLEPSCLSTFIDEAKEFGLDFSKHVPVISFEEYIHPLMDKLELKRFPYSIAYHIHCHEKSLFKNSYGLEILRSIPDAHVIPLETGCCGMAGSFGYEIEHIAISKKIFTQDLGLKLGSCDTNTWVITNGTSCRAQIQRYTKSHRTSHISELLLYLLKDTHEVH